MIQRLVSAISLMTMLAGAMVLEPNPSGARELIAVVVVCAGWGIGGATLVASGILEWAKR